MLPPNFRMQGARAGQNTRGNIRRVSEICQGISSMGTRGRKIVIARDVKFLELSTIHEVK